MLYEATCPALIEHARAATDTAKRRHAERQPTIWVQFAATALVIVIADARLVDTGTCSEKRRG
jgi:hypothetical protein